MQKQPRFQQMVFNWLDAQDWEADYDETFINFRFNLCLLSTEEEKKKYTLEFLQEDLWKMRLGLLGTTEFVEVDLKKWIEKRWDFFKSF